MSAIEVLSIIGAILVVGKLISLICRYFIPGISFYQRSRMMRHYRPAKGSAEYNLIDAACGWRVWFWVILCLSGTGVGLFLFIWHFLSYRSWMKEQFAMGLPHPTRLYKEMLREKKNTRRLDREAAKRRSTHYADADAEEIVQPALTS